MPNPIIHRVTTLSVTCGVLIAAIAAIAASAAAGEFNPTRSIGDPAPAWKDLPGVDGAKHSLADLAAKEVVVVVFTCNTCAASKDYEDRIIAFTKKHAGADSKVALVAINVNTVEDDRLPAMTKRAKERQFNFPYLYDETQNIAKEYGAIFTPEFFVLNRERKIVYMGAMDDHSLANKVTRSFLENAVQAALAGQSVDPAETVARGCMVRYNKIRRTRKAGASP